MADITPTVPDSFQVIQSYGPGRFRIAGTDHAGSVIVFRERTIPFDLSDVSSASVEAFAEVVAAANELDVLLLGCGPAIRPLPADCRSTLSDAGLMPDLMDTGAACRTFNVLLAEDRRVAAALIAL